MPPRPRCPNCRRYGASADKHLRVTPAGRAHYRCAKVPADAWITGSDYVKVFRPAPTSVHVYGFQEIQKQVFLRAVHRRFLADRRRELEEQKDNETIDEEQQVRAPCKNLVSICYNEDCYNEAHPGYEICRACLERSSELVCMEDSYDGSEEQKF